LGALAFLRDRRSVTPLAAAKFLWDLAHVVLPATFVLFAQHRFGWGPTQVGLTLGLVGVSTIIVQGFLVGRIVRALGEGRALLAGLACGAIAFTIYGLAPSGGWVFLGVPFGAFLGLATASGQSLMTRSVAVNEQGRLQGALASLMGLGGLIGPSIFAGAFAWGIAQPEGATLPGAAFFLAAGLLLVSALVAARAMRGQSRLEPTAL
jgi:DHA1 family tetracycline resistance protein-like MFS transporter